MRFTFLTLFTIILFSNAEAQNCTIEGKISQADSISSIPGVNVYLAKINSGTATNGNGYYSIKNIPAGTYILTVSSIGYATINKEINLKVNETMRADFILIETISALGEAVVMTNGNSGLKDIPGSAQYISPKEIQKFNYTDINRTLRTVPGINMQEEDGFGLRPNIGLRGTGVDRSSKITIMEDGVLMAPAPYADPAAYYFPTIGRMQAVEILKGSSQIKYGPFTTGGAINLISTQIPNKFSGKINLFGGSFGGRNLHAFVGNAHKNIAYSVETFNYGSNGFKELDGGGNTGFNKTDYLAKFQINTNPDAKVYQALTFKIGQVSEISNETYLGLTDDDFESNPYRRYSGSQKDVMKTEQSQSSATHFLKLSERFNVSTTAYYSEFARNWYKLDKVKDSTGTSTGIADLLENPAAHLDAYNIITGSSSTNSNALYVRANNRSYHAQGIQTALGYNFKTNEFAHDINFGFRFHEDGVDRFQWDDEYSMHNGIMQLTKSGTPGTESNRIKSAKAFATYVQYKIKFKNFIVIPGLRYENITISEKDYGKTNPDRTGSPLKESRNQVDVFIPGIGIDYQFTKYLSVFAGVHKGFSPPGPNDETVPEESVNYETGVRFGKNAIACQTVLFYNDYSNLLGTDLSASGGGGSGDLFNAGAVRSVGVEFQFAYDLISFRKQTEFSVPVTLIYTYTDAVFQNTFVSTYEDWGSVTAGDQFPYLAQNQFTIVLGLEYKKFGINVSGKYIDAMRTEPGQGEIPVNEKTDSYFVIDASVNYAIHANIAFFANATNLSNEIYSVARRPAGLRPGMPRAFNIGVKSNF